MKTTGWISKPARLARGSMAAAAVMLGLAAGSLAPVACAAAAEPVRVFVLAGQSNMDGRAYVSQMPASLGVPTRRVLIHYQHRPWRPVEPGYTGVRPEGKPMFGPELAFAQAIAERLDDRRLYILKSTLGNTTLAEDWDPDAPGEQYQALLDRIRIGLDRLREQGKTPQLVGLAWMQGESDARRQDWAEAYESNLVRFVTRLRKDLGTPRLPVVIGQVYVGADRDQPHNGLNMLRVHDAQARAVDVLEHAALVPTDDLTLKDKYHYDPDSTAHLGRRFAEQLLHLIAEQ